MGERQKNQTIVAIQGSTLSVSHNMTHVDGSVTVSRSQNTQSGDNNEIQRIQKHRDSRYRRNISIHWFDGECRARRQNL
jgi:hypothetical protein